jgi:hypothetical protein
MTLKGGIVDSPRVLLSDVRASQVVNISVSVLHSCDRNSCLGCPDTRLQGLCYAARQCAVTRCIGTVVNQKFFLCDAGLAVQSMTDQVINHAIGIHKARSLTRPCFQRPWPPRSAPGSSFPRPTPRS